jgi:ATP/ADP translocase
LSSIGTWTGVVAIILFVSFADDFARAMVWVSRGWVHPLVALALGGTVITTITLVLPGRLAARYIRPLSLRRALLYGAASGLLLAAAVLLGSGTASR